MLTYLEWLALIVITVLAALLLAVAIYSAYQVFTAKDEKD